MIEEQISIHLPAPWSGGTFEANLVGPINYLVGPNGKSHCLEVGSNTTIGNMNEFSNISRYYYEN